MGSLLHDLLAFRQDEFDMARVRHVGVNLYVEVIISHAVTSPRVDLSNVPDREHGMSDVAA